MKWTPSQGLKVQITQLMNDTIDCWYSFSGGNKANLAERSGVWKINIAGTSLRTRTFDRYLKLETLSNHPKVKKVLGFEFSVMGSATLIKDEQKSFTFNNSDYNNLEF